MNDKCCEHKPIGTRIDTQGYEVLKRTTRAGNIISYHVLLAEKALGEPLPKGAIIHHVNGVKNDNRGENLVVCPDIAYHELIHLRVNAKRACGKSGWRKCKYCKEYDAPGNLHFQRTGKGVYHRRCSTGYESSRYARSKS